LQHTSYVWTALRRVLSQAVTDAIRGMTMTADGTGAVFDVPDKHLAEVKQAMEQNDWLSVCESLPEVKEAFRPQASGWGGGWGGGRGGQGGGRGGQGFRNGERGP
jgi:ATP-dependent RNA helicase DDX21